MIRYGRLICPRVVGDVVSSPFKLLLLVTGIVVVTSALIGDQIIVWHCGMPVARPIVPINFNSTAQIGDMTERPEPSAPVSAYAAGGSHDQSRPFSFSHSSRSSTRRGAFI